MRQIQITDISTIDINKVVISAKASYNNGKDCHYAVGYQVDGALIQNIFSYGVSKWH